MLGLWSALLSITRLSILRLKPLGASPTDGFRLSLNNKTLNSEIETYSITMTRRCFLSVLSITRLSILRLKLRLLDDRGSHNFSLNNKTLNSEIETRLLRLGPIGTAGSLNNKTLNSEIETAFHPVLLARVCRVNSQ